MSRPQAFTVSATSGDMNVHQGVATDGVNIYGIDFGVIRKFDMSFSFVAENANAGANAGVNHLGDGCIHDGKLYVASEDFTSCLTNTNQRIAIFNTSDLSFVEYKDISAQGHEASGLVIDAENDRIYINTYCTNKIYSYKLSDFSYVGEIVFSTNLTHIQGITLKDEIFYVVEGYEGRIYKIALDGTVNLSWVWNGANEGLDYTTDYLYALNDPGEVETIYKLSPNSNYSDINSTLTINGSTT